MFLPSLFLARYNDKLEIIQEATKGKLRERKEKRELVGDPRTGGTAEQWGILPHPRQEKVIWAWHFLLPCLAPEDSQSRFIPAPSRGAWDFPPSLTNTQSDWVASTKGITHNKQPRLQRGTLGLHRPEMPSVHQGHQEDQLRNFLQLFRHQPEGQWEPLETGIVL